MPTSSATNSSIAPARMLGSRCAQCTIAATRIPTAMNAAKWKSVYTATNVRAFTALRPEDPQQSPAERRGRSQRMAVDHVESQEPECDCGGSQNSRDDSVPCD